MREIFCANGARGPVIVWRPPTERLAAPQLRFLIKYWNDLAGTRSMPLAREIDAVEMRSALGYVILLDVIGAGHDFCYRLFGSTIAGVSGFDMTGKSVSAHKASPYITEFFLAAYSAAFQRGEPLLTEHGPPAAVNTFAWHRLVLPLADDSGAVIRFLIGSVPMSRDGRPISLRL